MADGVLPPDPAALIDGAAGSAVARELIPRIPSTFRDAGGSSGAGQSGGNDEKVLESARSLCIALAEGTPQGVKLDAGVRLNMVIRQLRKFTLNCKHDEANRRLAHAKLNGDAAGAEEAYQQVVQLRKAIAELKSQSSNGL